MTIINIIISLYSNYLDISLLFERNKKYKPLQLFTTDISKISLILDISK